MLNISVSVVGSGGVGVVLVIAIIRRSSSNRSNRRGNGGIVVVVTIVIVVVVVVMVVVVVALVISSIIVVMTTLAVGSRDRHIVVVCGSSNSFLGSIETSVRSLLNIGGNRLHVVEMHVEEIAVRRNGLLLFFLADNLTSLLVILVNEDSSHGDVTVRAADSRDESELGAEGGLVGEVVGDIGVEDVVLCVVIEESLAIFTVAGGLVLVSSDGVFHGNVAGSTETIFVVSHTRVVVHSVITEGVEVVVVGDSLRLHFSNRVVVVVLGVVMSTEVARVHDEGGK